MKRIKVFKDILIKTGAAKILIIFIFVFFAISALVMIIEPTIDYYNDALWVSFSAVSTIGFGDVLLTHTVSRILIVILQIYAFFALAVVVGVIVAFYNKLYDRELELEIDKNNLDNEEEFNIEELVYDALNDPKYKDMTISQIKEHFNNLQKNIDDKNNKV